ncbi:Lcl C-terminal domain-containing protein [Desulfovulcanus sp.]
MAKITKEQEVLLDELLKWCKKREGILGCHYDPQTGQNNCFDEQGKIISCSQTGQDGEVKMGIPWPKPRFEVKEYKVYDHLTGLIWHIDANLSQKNISWSEALDFVHDLNKNSRLKWRLPNINELDSLVDASQHSPALPDNHPFLHVQEAYWSSTTSGFEPDWAYVLYLHKGAVGVGYKPKPEFALWPVTN